MDLMNPVGSFSIGVHRWCAVPFAIATALIVCAGCIAFVDPIEHFFRPTDILLLQDSRDSFAPVYRRSWDEHGLSIELYVVHGTNASLDYALNELTVDLVVYPRAARDRLHVISNRIVVVVESDTLQFCETKVECSRKLGRCSYRTSFSLTTGARSALTIGNDKLECTLDFSKVLTYDSQILDIGKIRCKMPRDSTHF